MLSGHPSSSFSFPRGLRRSHSGILEVARVPARDRWGPRFPSFLSLFVVYYTFTCVFSALPLGGSEQVGVAFLDFDLLPCLSD